MAWSFKITFATGAPLEFGVADPGRAVPIVTPRYDFAHTADEPPAVAEVTETWSIRDAYYLVETDTASMVDRFQSELVARLEDPDAPISAVELLLDGIPKFRMDTGSHNRLRILRVVPDEFEQAGGTAFIRFSLEAQGSKVTRATSVEQQLSIRYERGFEVRGLTTRVKTPRGVSARSTVESLGALSRPSSFWRYETCKAPYVNVSRNQADTEAEGICTLREQGLAIPAGLNEFTRQRRTEKSADGSLVTLSVAAQGTGAKAAVEGQRPAGVLRESIAFDESAQAATAVFITETAPEGSVDGTVERSRIFTVHGGARPKTWTPISGMDQSWLTVGARRPLFLQEEYSVRSIGAQAPGDILTERLLFPTRFEQDRSRESLPRLVRRSTSPESDLWERTASRVYVFPDGRGPTAEELFEATLASARLQDLDLQTEPDWQAARDAGG